MTTSPPSLRERHRRRTSAEIHQAAYELTSQLGYSETTVEAVAERAGISRRTFFNYYQCKEDAVLGLTPPRILPEHLERYGSAEETDELARTVRLFIGILRDSSGMGGFEKGLLDIVREHPELKRRIGLQIAAAETLVAETMMQQQAGPRSQETSQAIVLLAGAVIKFMVRTNPDLAHSADSVALEKALTHATGVFRTAFKEIS